MSLIPAFEIGVWNAWILIVPYLLVNFGLSFSFVGRKSAFWVFPSYTRLERMCLVTGELLMGGLWIYRISRHPMYLGILLVYIGIGIASSSWLYLLLAFAYLATYRNAFTIPEERFCCEKFGDAYREYMNRTPR